MSDLPHKFLFYGSLIIFAVLSMPIMGRLNDERAKVRELQAQVTALERENLELRESLACHWPPNDCYEFPWPELEAACPTTD